MGRLSKVQLLKILNDELTRTYRTALISGICLVITVLICVLFMSRGYGLTVYSIAIITWLNYRRVVRSAKYNIGVIYIDNKSQCDALMFFKVFDEDTVKCSLGLINLRRVRKKLEKKKLRGQ